MRKLRNKLQRGDKEPVKSNGGKKRQVAVKKGVKSVVQVKKSKDVVEDNNERKNATKVEEEEEDEEEVAEDDNDNDDESSFGTGCLVCGSGKNESKILLCETCDGEYHIYCLDPPLKKVPKEDWYCHLCVAKQSKKSTTTSTLPTTFTTTTTTTTTTSTTDSNVTVAATATDHVDAVVQVPDSTNNDQLKPTKKNDKDITKKIVISSSSNNDGDNNNNTNSNNDILPPVARSTKRVNTVLKSTTMSSPLVLSISPNTIPLETITSTKLNTTNTIPPLPRTTTTAAVATTSTTSTAAIATRGTTIPTTEIVPKRTITPADIMEYDGLEELVSALPYEYISRFGEIVWAQAGTGYGWWPSIICDPRYMIEPTRTMARKWVGKKFLVHFFRCGTETATSTTTNNTNNETDIKSRNNTDSTSAVDNRDNHIESSTTTILNTEAHNSYESNMNSVQVPRIGSAFAMVGKKQLKKWYDGIADEFYSGRTAKNFGGYKSDLFQEAFSQAMLELDKPIEERCDWTKVSSTEYFVPYESASPGVGYPAHDPTKNVTTAGTRTLDASSSSALSSSVQSTPSKRRLLDTHTGINVCTATVQQLDTNMPMTSQKLSSKEHTHKMTSTGSNFEEKVIKNGTFKLKFAQRLPLDQLLTQMITAAQDKHSSPS